MNYAELHTWLKQSSDFQCDKKLMEFHFNVNLQGEKYQFQYQVQKKI